MRKLNAGEYVLISIMVVMLAAIIELLRFKSFSTKIMPIVVSGSVFVLAAVQLWLEMRAKGSTDSVAADAESHREEENKPAGRQYLTIAAWLAGFAISIYLIGFYLGSFLLILSYMKRNGSKWVGSIFLAVLSTAIMYTVFEVFLTAGLHPGLISRWF